MLRHRGISPNNDAEGSFPLPPPAAAPHGNLRSGPIRHHRVVSATPTSRDGGAHVTKKALKNEHITCQKMYPTLASFLGVTWRTRIKVIGGKSDALLIRYDVNRPLAHFYRIDTRPSDACLIFQETVNYKHPVLGVVPDGDEVQVYTSRGIFVSALHNRQCYKFVSSDSIACCVVGDGLRVLVRPAFGGLEVTGGGAPLCRIPDAPSRNSARPVLCQVTVGEKSFREERCRLALPARTFYALFGAVYGPVLVLGLRDGRVLSIGTEPRARPRLLCRLRQAVVDICAAALSDENDCEIPVLIALGRQGQVAAMTGTGVHMADAPAPFDCISRLENSAEMFHVSRGLLWTTQLRLHSDERAATLVARSRTAAIMGVVDAQPLTCGRVAVLTEAGSLLSCSIGEGACKPQALVRSMTEIATNLHRARSLLSRRQAHLRDLRLCMEPVTVTADRADVPGGPLTVRFRNLPRDCGWWCCVSLRNEGKGIACRCVPTLREETEDSVTLWLEEPRGCYLEACPWLLLAPGVPLALQRIPLVVYRPQSTARLVLTFAVASSTGSTQGLLRWLNEITKIEKSESATSVVARETSSVSVALDCGDLRSFAALHCAVARRLLEALRRCEVPGELRFQVLPACALALRMLQGREGEALDAYRSWRHALAGLVLA